MIYSQRDEKECNFDPDLRWTVVLWDRVCRGGLGGAEPTQPGLTLDRENPRFCGPGRGVGA